ncbi:MAG TPA: S8 family serine peptidase [Burkholderiaceae bacterium]|nr:S8 family serine peptidase [Burkholderiaceae bacterium]
MQRILRAALSGSVFVSLVSCGGADAPEPAESSPQTQGQVLAAASAKRATAGTDKARGATVAGRRAGKTYIVQLSEPAVAAYAGGIRGFAATRPERGSKLDTKAPAVAGYRAYLQSRHEAVLGSVGAARKVYSYAYTFNGFAAELSEAQAQKLAGTPGVLAVVEDELRKPDTASTPQFLGLSGRDGFWRETGARGENVIIGMVDSGIWPELKSFSDRRPPGLLDEAIERQGEVSGDRHGGWPDGDSAYRPIRGWGGTCVTGEQFTAANCNNKLIGARYYNADFGGDAAVKASFPYEYISPRDADGHGTHTAATAGGNANVAVTGPAAAYGKVSGMAPRARIAVYKVCWGRTEANAGCFPSDSVAAIDQAVEDGVDVINFSISGTTGNFLDPVEQAFMRAADACVFVAASAGNSGPAASTVAHPSPWVTTVAAGTHNRTLVGSVTLGNGTVLGGASAAAAALPSTPLINAADAGLAGANATAVRLCFAAEDNGGVAVLDPAKVQGKIVICDRGSNARVNKSLAVAEAGGVGMVLVNTSTNTLNADFHSVPTVHLQVAEGSTAKAYAAAAGGTGAISKATLDLTAPAPFTASFSSRGPTRAADGNLLKPDVMAPGQDILAGVSPPGNGGREFDLLSGTSMSSPHIAGIAALLKELHPRWSPMAIKSALMTSAGDVLDGPNTSPAVIFSQGAGHVQPNSAADPGLVFDSDIEDWLGFLCGTQVPASLCTSNGIAVLDPSDMNTASIAISSLPGAQTVTRRVTNVSHGFATYTAAVSGMEGFNVVMKPRTMTLAPGQTRSFKLTFTRTTAALNTYAGGQLTLTGGTLLHGFRQYKVRVPLVARPVALVAPPQAAGSYAVKFGYSGPFQASLRGLAAASAQSGNVATDGVVMHSVTVPAGTTYARFALFDANVAPASDLDLVVLGPAGNVVGSSSGGTSQEEVNLTNPPAGTYTVVVQGFSVPGASGANYTLFSWALGGGAAGNVALSAPTAAVLGTSATIGLSFTGLQAGTKYLGVVNYSNGTESLGAPTFLRVDP